MEAISKIVPGANVPVSYLSDSFTRNSKAFAEVPKYSRYPKLPFFRTRDNVCVTRWQLTWRERLRLALTGSIWHSVSLANTNYQPFLLHAVCPLTVKQGTTVATINAEGEKLGVHTPPEAVLGLNTVVLMSSRGMLDHFAAAECLRLDWNWNGSSVTIRGHRDFGEFATEDDAIMVYAAHMRAQNKGKAPASA